MYDPYVRSSRRSFAQSPASFFNGVLGKFGQHAGTNTDLAGEWCLSSEHFGRDTETKRQEVDQESMYSALWTHLLLQILRLCIDARHEVCTVAIQTLFRTLQP